MSHSTDHAGAHHGGVKTYLVGFILSVILTVMNGTASHGTLLGVVVATAVVQILVHLVCFLHMNASSEERWNLVAFVFTLLIIAIVVVGSIWIMWSLNENMMVH